MIAKEKTTPIIALTLIVLLSASWFAQIEIEIGQSTAQGQFSRTTTRPTPSPSKPSLIPNNALCGNGIMEGGEECDDGENDGTWCTNACQLTADNLVWNMNGLPALTKLHGTTIYDTDRSGAGDKLYSIWGDFTQGTLVFMHNLTDGTYLGSIDLRNEPNRLHQGTAGGVAGNYLVIFARGNNGAIDLTTDTLATKIPNPSTGNGTGFGQAAVKKNQNAIYGILGATSHVSEIDTTQSPPSFANSALIGEEYSGLALSGDETKLYAAHSIDPKLKIIDLVNQSVTTKSFSQAEIKLSGNGLEIEVGPDNNVYINYQEEDLSGHIVKLDPEGNIITVFNVGEWSAGIDILPHPQYSYLITNKKIFSYVTGREVFSDGGNTGGGTAEIYIVDDKTIESKRKFLGIMTNRNNNYIKTLESFPSVP